MKKLTTTILLGAALAALGDVVLDVLRCLFGERDHAASFFPELCFFL